MIRSPAPAPLAPAGPRGITIVTVLILLVLAGGVYWLVVFGGAYWDNQEVKAVVRQAGNIAYSQPNDDQIRSFIIKKTQDMFEYEYEEFGQRKKGYKVDLRPEDVLIERNQVPPWIRIDVTYSRIIRPPFHQPEKQLDFAIHVDQDLSPVKW